jgi:hypothetical protein
MSQIVMDGGAIGGRFHFFRESSGDPIKLLAPFTTRSVQSLSFCGLLFARITIKAWYCMGYVALWRVFFWSVGRGFPNIF